MTKGNHTFTTSWNHTAGPSVFIAMVLIALDSIIRCCWSAYKDSAMLNIGVGVLVITLVAFDLWHSWLNRRRASVQQDEFNCYVDFCKFKLDLFLCEDGETLGITAEHEDDDMKNIDLFITRDMKVTPPPAAR